MFGSRRSGARGRRHGEAGTLVRRGRTAARVGNYPAAAQAQRAAADVLRDLAETDPGDPRDGQALADVLGELGESLVAGGRPEEGVAALDEAEETYARLPGHRFPVADRVADVQARRAIAYGMAGAGASAVVDAQSAVVHYRLHGGDDPRQWALARALSVNADVLAAYGDPDLAVGSADQAVRLYLRQAAGINASPDAAVHVPALRRAVIIASAVHAAHGRRDLAEQADAIGRRMSGQGSAVVTVLAERQRSAHPPVLAVTVATALDRAERQLGRQAPWVGGQPAVRPAVDAELTVPVERALLPLGAGPTAADAAARLGGTLAGTALELLPYDPVGGLRLGLDAHALLAGASRLESPTLSHQLPALGPPWAAVLLACSRLAERDRDPALALDLAAWAGGVAERMFPATLVDREAREVAVQVLDHHGRLLAERGEDDRARDALRAAARLRGV